MAARVNWVVADPSYGEHAPAWHGEADLVVGKPGFAGLDEVQRTPDWPGRDLGAPGGAGRVDRRRIQQLGFSNDACVGHTEQIDAVHPADTEGEVHRRLAAQSSDAVGPASWDVEGGSGGEEARPDGSLSGSGRRERRQRTKFAWFMYFPVLATGELDDDHVVVVPVRTEARRVAVAEVAVDLHVRPIGRRQVVAQFDGVHPKRMWASLSAIVRCDSRALATSKNPKRPSRQW